MNHRASPRFWQCYRQLPEEIRQLADKFISSYARTRTILPCI